MDPIFLTFPKLHPWYS